MVLVLIGVAIVVRRTAQLVPLLINGYQPPAAVSDPAAVSFVGLDDVFARYPALTLVHILPGLLFVVLAWASWMGFAYGMIWLIRPTNNSSTLVLATAPAVG